MKLTDLQERRALIVAEMRGLTDKPTGQAGDLSDEQTKRFDALKAELQGLEQRIERQRFLDEAERKAQGTPVHGSGDNKLDEALRGFSLRKAICSQIPDLVRQVDCGRELELSAELAKRSARTFQGVPVPMSVFHMEKRTITSSAVSPDFGGRNLVGTDHLGNEFIDVLRARLITRRLGARILSGLTGDVEIPKQSAAAGTNWLAEDAELGDSDPTFSKITLQPKHCGAMTEFSRNMLLQSSPDIEQLIRQDFAALHLKDRSDDGLIGRSRLQRAAQVVQAGMSIQTLLQGEPRQFPGPFHLAIDVSRQRTHCGTPIGSPQRDLNAAQTSVGLSRRCDHDAREEATTYRKGFSGSGAACFLLQFLMVS
jgi:hypothetical protein